MTSSDINAIVFVIINVIIYLLRDTYPFNKIWFVLRAFWVALFGVLIFGFLKDQFKKR
ncbi:hypothetical protein PBAC_22420 [Pedobacter glucosidilyticus]|nr:hypothetical protein [Pedobacter glucosidilyticus]KHJ37524.1 hypothetical protein PBAC_22420 [Pedobacter glucosidilyticus]